MKNEANMTEAHQPILIRESGRIWFSAMAERRFYFFLTMVMLTAGILYKLGVL